MKDKNTTVLLAFFLGWIGAHRFYLGQRVLGVLYIVLLFTFGISFIIALIDFIGLLAMRRDRFDYLYNRKFFDDDYLKFVERRNRAYTSNAPMKKREKKVIGKLSRNPNEALQDVKTRGKEHYKNFEYKEATEMFEKALEINSRDAAVHFNLACCFSLMENTERTFRHLSLAVANGFDKMEKIKSHPGLAFIRIQDEWDSFSANGYKLTPSLEIPTEDLLSGNGPKESGDVPEKDSKILVRLRQLKDQRDRGIISNVEFEEQKKRIL